MLEKTTLLEYIKNLPNILVIDDDYGKDVEKREAFCQTNGIIDITSGSEIKESSIKFIFKEETLTGGQFILYETQKFDYIPVSKAKFISGQNYKGQDRINDIDLVINELRNGWNLGVTWNLILLDLHFEEFIGGEKISLKQNKEEFGIEILKKVNELEEFRDLPIIVLSGKDRKDFEVEFANIGLKKFESREKITSRQKIVELIFNYGLIPDNNALDFLFNRYYRILALHQQQQPVSWQDMFNAITISKENNNIKYIIGKSKSLLKCLREARRRSRITNELGGDNILLLSESGTGKELLAKYIHRMSGRSGNFEIIFTQGIADTLLEDNIFGHVKGAFDGAVDDLQGAAEIAENGTLFIDEFGEIPLKLQSKFLRLLDKGIRETVRMGAKTVRRVNILTILATNRMELLSGSGDFREDLLARIDIQNPIILPNLSKRKDDIELLTRFFVRKYENIFKSNQREISEDSISYLKKQNWNYNIRGLEQTIMRVVYEFSDIKILSPNHFLYIKKDEINHYKNEVKAENKDSQNISIVPKLDYSQNSITELIEFMKTFDFEFVPEKDLKGLLIKLEENYRIMIFHLLKAFYKRESKLDRRKNFILPPLQKIINVLLNKNSIRQSTPLRILKEVFIDSKYYSTNTEELIKKEAFGELFFQIVKNKITNSVNKIPKSKLKELLNKKILIEDEKKQIKVNFE